MTTDGLAVLHNHGRVAVEEIAICQRSGDFFTEFPGVGTGQEAVGKALGRRAAVAAVGRLDGLDAVLRGGIIDGGPRGTVKMIDGGVIRIEDLAAVQGRRGWSKGCSVPLRGCFCRSLRLFRAALVVWAPA